MVRVQYRPARARARRELPRFAVALALVVSGACGGSTSNEAGPSAAGPAEANAPGAGGSLPCDVDAVLAKNCRLCHSAPPQYGAPMPLVTWSDLHAPAVSDGSKRVFELVAEKIADDDAPMPPPPNARLSAAARATLTNWVAAGAPRGDGGCGDTNVPGGSAVSCTPNLSLSPSEPWEMPAESDDEYVCWGVDLTRPDPTHVTAFVPRIDNTTIVHHLVMYEAPTSYDAKPKRCNSATSLSWRMVLGWAPGTGALELPPEAGFPIATSGATHYVVQMHYSNPGALPGQKDASGIDLCTSPPRKYEADVMAFGTQDIDIPPNDAHELECSLTVPQQFAGLHFFAAMPHMHKLGTRMKTELVPKAGGPKVDLGTMETFDFERQSWLPIKDAVTAAGDVITTTCAWNNPTGAPVRFGENTADEMCYSFTMYYPRITLPLWSWAVPASPPPLGASCVTK